MRIVRNISMCAVILFVLIGTLGCTKENLEGCIPTATIDFSFSFTKNKSGEDKFTTDVHRLDLLVFNSEGLYIKRVTAQGPFAEGYILPVELPTDQSYSFVAWGDISDSYSENHIEADGSLSGLELQKSTLESARLALVQDGSDVRKPIGILFHGTLKDVLFEGTSLKEGHIALTNNRNIVRTTITGLKVPANKAALDETNPVAEVQYRGANGLFLFDNTLAANAPKGTYFPYKSDLAGTTLTTEIALPRLMIGHSITLAIISYVDNPNGREIHSENLLSLIRELGIRTQDGLDKEEIYEISIDVSGAPNYIVIFINGWKIVRISVDL